MALPDKIDGFHRDISVLTALGSAISLIGMSSFMMSYEYKDFERVQIQGHDRMEEVFNRRRKTSIWIMAVCAILYVAGIVLITLGVSLYPSEREELASSIPGQISQIRNNNAQPETNESAILSAISSAIIVAGMGYGTYTFNKTEDWGWIASGIYGVGWIGQSFAAAMNNKSIDSLVMNRLAWTLPGAAAILFGTVIFPWQLEHNYISGPAWPISALGYAAFTIGTSYLTTAPE
jgi:hypothetical protein